MYLKFCIIENGSREIVARASRAFDLQLYFIYYYINIYLKKLRFETDGTFESFAVLLGIQSYRVDNIFKRIIIGAEFDFQKFDSLSTKDRSLYVIDVFKDTLTKLSKIKDIPLKEIFSYCDELIESGLEYKWKFRGLRLPQYGLRAVFNCVLNSREYLLTINVYKKGLKEPICEGRVARTLPDRFYFSIISRDIGVEENRIVIKDHIDKFPILYLKISDLCNGKVLPIDAEPIIQEDIYVKYLRRNQKILRYDNDNYIIQPIEK